MTLIHSLQAGLAASFLAVYPFGEAVQAMPGSPPGPSDYVSAQLPASAPMNSSAVRLNLSEVYSDLYVLGPADILQLSFLDPAAKEVGGTLTILPDGTSSLPLLGSVQLTGLTIGQATRWLTSLYSKQLKRPQLFLTLTTPRPVKVSIIGEVEKPGLYPLKAFSTPISAIQEAGGVTLNSDIRKVVLRRQAGLDGTQKQTILDISQVLLQGNQLQNPILFDGDTIIVSRTIEVVPSEIRQIGFSNLAPTSITVSVIGEVKTPGSLKLPANTPLLEAIFRSGGPVRWRANRNNVQLVRFGRDGKATRQTFSYAQPTDLTLKNPPLRNGDTVVVSSSVYGKVLDFFKDISIPIGTASSAANIYNVWTRWGWQNNN